MLIPFGTPVVVTSETGIIEKAFVRYSVDRLDTNVTDVFVRYIDGTTGRVLSSQIDVLA